MQFQREFSLDKLYIAPHMKLRFIKVFIVFLIFGFSNEITAQSDALEAEKNDLLFQDYFFEALKQKAILNYSKAVENLEKSAQIKKENVAVMFELSKNYLLMERYFEAGIFIDRCLKKEPQNIDLLRHKVRIFTAQRMFDKAIALQKKIAALQPMYRTELAHIYIQNEAYDLAETELNAIVEDGQSTVKTVYYLNFLARRKQNSEVATTSVAEVNSDAASLRAEFQKSNDYNTLKRLLQQDERQNDFESLLNDSQEGMDLFPAQPYVYQMNARALNGLGKYNDALVVLSIGEDFIVENSEMQLQFYEAYLVAYKGLNDSDEVASYELKIKKLRGELNE